MQYLLIMSGLICKVFPGTTVAWRRQAGARLCMSVLQKDVHQACCYDLTWRQYQVHCHLPKQINTHTSGKLSPACSVHAHYGNVVKWPTGISGRIRDCRDLVGRMIPQDQNRLTGCLSFRMQVILCVILKHRCAPQCV